MGDCGGYTGISGLGDPPRTTLRWVYVFDVGTFLGVRIEGGCSAGVYVEWELKGRSREIGGDRGG